MINSSTATAAGQSGAADPVVLELFTSQSCSSCPPADRLAERLARDPSLLVISRAVTYWDRLGWKDTLGRSENTALQRAYAAKGRAGAGVYTPQIVVDGEDSAVGSEEAEIRQLIAAARTRIKPQIAIAAAPGGGFAAAVAGEAQDGEAEVVLVGLTARRAVAIASGENGGSRIVYTNVFVGERRLGSWAGGTHSFSVPSAQLTIRGADSYAVLLRQSGAGRILAGRMAT